MTAAPDPASPSRRAAEREQGGAPGGAGLFPAARRFLPAERLDDWRIVADYAAALRAVVDHPALEPARKEARLKALADAIEGEAAGAEGDAALRAALTLRHLLESRGLTLQDPWQMLQAAGQDIRKTSYADWSDLIAWCRYWAAPMGRMGHRLAGGDDGGLVGAESFAMATQLLYLAEQAATHQRWLGRVYFPVRWFQEAGADPSDLMAARATPALRTVFSRLIGEVQQLLAVSAGLYRFLPGVRIRIAAAVAHAEARAWARQLARSDPLANPGRGGGAAGIRAIAAGMARGLLS
ncbi:MAG: squalene/phytoene synthase family protein [Alphaproteobacteria bacterium]|nr:squalene/phytoene synthase family protein [Alphaproteobacteria bacterium]